MRAWLWPGYARVEVPSDSHPDETHTVFIRGSKCLCTCDGFRYRSHCRHEAQVEGLLAVPDEEDERKLYMPKHDLNGLLEELDL
jgi:hypothetical protein